MSTVSPQAGAAGEISTWQADLSQRLAGISLPELQKIIGGGPGATKSSTLPGMLASQNAQGQMGVDTQNYQSALQTLNQGYGNAQFSSKEGISYNALRGGTGREMGGATQSAITSAATSLERDQMAAQRNLQFMSAQSSMKDYNTVLQLLGQGSNTALGLASGFAGTSAAALQGMSNTTQMSGALGGATAGAGAGMAAGPYGALAGAVIGGVAGYASAG